MKGEKNSFCKNKIKCLAIFDPFLVETKTSLKIFFCVCLEILGGNYLIMVFLIFIFGAIGYAVGSNKSIKMDYTPLTGTGTKHVDVEMHTPTYTQ